MKTELNKGKSSTKVSQTTDELQFLMDFNSSITQSMAKTLEHLTDFVFVTVANTTLPRPDSYLSHLKLGIKPDTFAALRTGPLHIPTLFPDIANLKARDKPSLGRKVAFTLTSVRTNIQNSLSQTVLLGIPSFCLSVLSIDTIM